MTDTYHHDGYGDESAAMAADQSGHIGKLAEALAKAQASISCPEKNRNVTVRTKTGGSYEFAYATLDAVIEGVRPHLTANGLWWVQLLGKSTIRTVLMHSSGQWIASEVPIIVEEPGNQKYGSAVTYMRRYALTAILGLAAEEDDDGNAADGNEAKVTPRAPKPANDNSIVSRSQERRLAASTPAPIDPKTGEASPHTIEHQGDDTAWAVLYNAAIGAAKTADEVKAWGTLNGATLVKIAKSAPKLSARINERVAEISDALDLRQLKAEDAAFIAELDEQWSAKTDNKGLNEIWDGYANEIAKRSVSNDPFARLVKSRHAKHLYRVATQPSRKAAA